MEERKLVAIMSSHFAHHVWKGYLDVFMKNQCQILGIKLQNNETFLKFRKFSSMLHGQLNMVLSSVEYPVCLQWLSWAVTEWSGCSLYFRIDELFSSELFSSIKLRFDPRMC